MRKTAREDDDMELLDDGNAEDAHKQKQKRKAHAKKKQSIGHWLWQVPALHVQAGRFAG